MAIPRYEIRCFITLTLQLKERQNIGLRRVWEVGEKREGCCGGYRKCNRSADASAGVSKRVVAAVVVEGRRFVRREKRERNVIERRRRRASPPPSHPFVLILVILVTLSGLSTVAIPRCLPSGAQSRATTEIRLAIIVDDKVEQCRTPASRRTAVPAEKGWKISSQDKTAT